MYKVLNGCDLRAAEMDEAQGRTTTYPATDWMPLSEAPPFILQEISDGRRMPSTWS